MASPRKPGKQGPGWSGFLQKAVASVESKLDNILAEEDDRPPRSVTPLGPVKESTASKRNSEELSRSNSGTKANDRLQERLNRAMAKRKNEGRNSPLPGADSSGTATPATTPVSESMGKGKESALAELAVSGEVDSGTALTQPEVTAGLQHHGEVSTVTLLPVPNTADEPVSRPVSDIATPTTTSGRTSLDTAPPSIQNGAYTGPLGSSSTHTVEIQLPDRQSMGIDTSILRLEVGHEALEQKLQEELHPYIEKIDALQSKLQYLSREAAESAHQAAAAAQPGTAERKLLEKDERIALLLEEGQKLSKNEMKHLALIKNLRSQTTSNLKEQAALKSRADAAEKSRAAAEQRALRAEKKLQSSTTEDWEFEEIKKERNALAATVAEMKADVARLTTRAEVAERRMQIDDMDMLRKQNEELRDDLTNAKIERELSEEKLRREISDLAASVALEKERFNMTETEMLGEQAALERKLESLRSRAEEVSSTTQGDGQAKLLRQIETLQTQYSVASENWQGIEGSLLSRIANVEQERDEVAKREADLRRKARDFALKAKKIEQELEMEKDRNQELEKSLAEQQAELHQMTRRAQEAEEQLSQRNKTLKEHQESLEKEVATRVAEERAKLIPLLQAERNASPAMSFRRPSGLDLAHLTSPSYSRSPTVLPTFSPDSHTPPRQNSSASFRAHVNGAVSHTPSIHSTDHDEYFANGMPTPTSPALTHRGVNDLISTSTVGAGPSVQLVERMSATVRRLESEKAASKDELARLTAQRDEARQEVVSLMREVEAKRATDERVKALEEEQREINERYQTTLELLGEKSELVEELKADIVDVKQMYRDLVETMK